MGSYEWLASCAGAYINLPIQGRPPAELLYTSVPGGLRLKFVNSRPSIP